MTEIRTKDRLFIAVVVPAIVALVYWYGWREDAGKRIDSLRQRQALLVAEEDFDAEIAKARRMRESADEELDAERKIPIPANKVRADAAASESERARAVVETFRAADLKIVRSEIVDESKTGWGKCGEMLRATGTRPRPVCRAYTIEGAYPAVMSALTAFASAQSAVIPASLFMSSANRWTVSVFL